MLEFPESTLRQYWETGQPQLRALRAAGFGVGVDEFGIGLDLNDKLSNELFSAVKIDRSFVQGISTNPHLQAILRDNIQLAKTHNLTVIAIGVEAPEDLNTLSDLGCDAVQGYIFSPPVSGPDFMQWIAKSKQR